MYCSLVVWYWPPGTGQRSEQQAVALDLTEPLLSAESYRVLFFYDVELVWKLIIVFVCACAEYYMKWIVWTGQYSILYINKYLYIVIYNFIYTYTKWAKKNIEHITISLWKHISKGKVLLTFTRCQLNQGEHYSKTVIPNKIVSTAFRKRK